MIEPLLKCEIDSETKFFPKSTASITSIDTGNNADNVIPEKVSAKFNIRFNDSKSKTSLEEYLIKHFNSISKNYEVEFFSNADPFITKPGKEVLSLSNAINKITMVITQPTILF